MVVFSQRYGHICQLSARPFSKTGRHFVYKQYYRLKSKTKAVLRVNYGDDGDSSTVVLEYENRHFILSILYQVKQIIKCDSTWEKGLFFRAFFKIELLLL